MGKVKGVKGVVKTTYYHKDVITTTQELGGFEFESNLNYHQVFLEILHRSTGTDLRVFVSKLEEKLHTIFKGGKSTSSFSIDRLNTINLATVTYPIGYTINFTVDDFYIQTIKYKLLEYLNFPTNIVVTGDIEITEEDKDHYKLHKEGSILYESVNLDDYCANITRFINETSC